MARELGVRNRCGGRAALPCRAACGQAASARAAGAAQLMPLGRWDSHAPRCWRSAAPLVSWSQAHLAGSCAPRRPAVPHITARLPALLGVHCSGGFFEGDDDFCQALVDGGCVKALQLQLCRDVEGAQFVEALEEALAPRMRLMGGAPPPPPPPAVPVGCAPARHRLPAVPVGVHPPAAAVLLPPQAASLALWPGTGAAPAVRGVAAGARVQCPPAPTHLLAAAPSRPPARPPPRPPAPRAGQVAGLR